MLDFYWLLNFEHKTSWKK